MIFSLFEKLPRSVGRSARCFVNWPTPRPMPTSPEKPELLFLLVDDVDDPGHAGGVESRRRVVDDFDRLDVGRRHAVEPALAAEAGQARLPAVDQDRHAVAAAQRDLAFLIHGHARNTLHRVEHRTGGLRCALIEPEHLRVDAFRADRGGGHRHRSPRTPPGDQTDVAEVVRLVERADQHVGLRRLKPGKRDPDLVRARRQSLDEEAAVLGAQRAGKSLPGRGVLDEHRRETDWRAIGHVQHAAGDRRGGLLRERNRRDEQRDEQDAEQPE